MLLDERKSFSHNGRFTVSLAKKLKYSGFRVVVMTYWLSGYNKKELCRKVGTDWHETSDEAVMIRKESRSLNKEILINRRRKNHR